MNKQQIAFGILIVCVVFGCLFPGCQKEILSSVHSQSNTVGKTLTEEMVNSTTEITINTIDDTEMPYFTWEEFETIVPGKSTAMDVRNATGVYTSMLSTSYGGVSVYPLRNGKYMRIEYGEGFVVRNKEIVESTQIPISPHNTIGFDDYTSYIAFVKNCAAEKPLSELRTSKEIKAYIQSMREDHFPLMLPCHRGARIALEIEADFPAQSTVYICYDLFAGTGFITFIDECKIRICIYALTEENAALAKEMSCPELLAALHPTEPNVGSFNTGYYTAVFEDTAMIAGASRSMLVQQTTDGHEQIYFVLDGCLVEIQAPTGTVTKDWLQEFSLVAA